MRYNEAVYDKSTGLYYLSARYYDPENGRFLTRDSYRGNLSNPSTLHLYAYCANNPVNCEDSSGHIAISRIVGGIVGGAAGAWIGTKIAKKTKAKGWKKVAIIAGCTIGGAVIGAIAGPKVAKVAKKAAAKLSSKLPKRSTKLRVSKQTVKKPKAGNSKLSKVKQAVSNGKQKVSNIKNKTSNIIKKAKTKKQSGTGTVWDNIKATDSMRDGTRIPKSFEVTTKSEKFWVHPNGTKHMAEYIRRNGISHGMPMQSQELLTSFQSSVESAVMGGIKFENTMMVGNWELQEILKI